MNQVVLITGAGSGLGLSLAEKFVSRGDLVYGVTRTKCHWKQARMRVSSKNKFHLFQIDVTSESNVKQFIRRVHEKAGKIDIVINNAGHANGLKRTEEHTLAEFQKHLSGNLLSTFFVCKSVIPILRKQRSGKIINISSMAGKRAVPRLSAYSASKFAVLALTQSIAKENLEAGFECITVCPGGMNTEMRAEMFGQEDAYQQQSPDFVADKILEYVDGRLSIPSGGDIVIRHGQITAINPPPEA